MDTGRRFFLVRGSPELPLREAFATDVSLSVRVAVGEAESIQSRSLKLATSFAYADETVGDLVRWCNRPRESSYGGIPVGLLDREVLVEDELEKMDLKRLEKVMLGVAREGVKVRVQCAGDLRMLAVRLGKGCEEVRE